MKTSLKFVSALACCIFSSATTVTAQELKQLLEVHTTEGRIITFDLSHQPIGKISGTDMVISTDTETVLFPLEDIAKFVYTESVAALLDVEAERTNVILRDNTLTVLSPTAGGIISICRPDGMVLQRHEFTDSSFTLSLNDYTDGIYLVNVAGQTFKILKR